MLNCVKNQGVVESIVGIYGALVLISFKNRTMFRTQNM